VFRVRVKPFVLTFLLGIAVTRVAAQEASSPVHNIVLVHGAWADGSSWVKVIPLTPSCRCRAQLPT